VPDYWLDFNPWEFPRHDVTVDVSQEDPARLGVDFENCKRAIFADLF
jgi:hypothetical protein